MPQQDKSGYITFETNTTFHEPEANIAAMLDAIESLPSHAKPCWEACVIREFNVGYDCGDEPWAFQQQFSNQLLARLAACGATFAITLYPPDNKPEAP